MKSSALFGQFPNVFNYEYFLTDHLGNMRASFDNSGPGGTANLLQEQGYYPYGGTFNEYLPASPTRYTYQGKEYQDELNLNQYDFEARNYDPWGPYTDTPDPHADNHSSESPHSWLGGNPINNICISPLKSWTGGIENKLLYLTCPSYECILTNFKFLFPSRLSAANPAETD